MPVPFDTNNATTGFGGALLVVDGAGARLTRCDMAGNTAALGGGSIAVFSLGQSATVGMVGGAVRHGVARLGGGLFVSTRQTGSDATTVTSELCSSFSMHGYVKLPVARIVTALCT